MAACGVAPNTETGVLAGSSFFSGAAGVPTNWGTENGVSSFFVVLVVVEAVGVGTMSLLLSETVVLGCPNVKVNLGADSVLDATAGADPLLLGIRAGNENCEMVGGALTSAAGTGAPNVNGFGAAASGAADAAGVVAAPPKENETEVEADGVGAGAVSNKKVGAADLDPAPSLISPSGRA